MGKKKYVYLIDELIAGKGEPFQIVDEGDIVNIPNSITLIEDSMNFDMANYKISKPNIDEVLGFEDRLNKVKLEKIEELKKTRDRLIEEDIEVHGSMFQVKSSDLENFYDLALSILINPELKSELITWRLADNTSREFTGSQILEVLLHRVERKKDIFKTFLMLVDTVSLMIDENEVLKFKWRGE